jgi:very-short-patch-repair endonuclease
MVEGFAWDFNQPMDQQIEEYGKFRIKLPQYSCRVDFLLKLDNGRELVVECDGGRHQQIHGWPVMRFTADDIYWRAEVCCREIRQMLWELTKRI